MPQNPPFILSTVDTDIVAHALTLYFSSKILIQIDFGKRRRILDIQNIMFELGAALPALHSFADNDYTSAFHGMGKKKVLFSSVQKPDTFVAAFKALVDHAVFDPTLYYPNSCSNCM